MASFLCDKAMGLNNLPIIDLGYINDDSTSERYHKLLAFGIGQKNFNVFFTGRLVCRPPKSKVEKVMSAFPIKEGGSYWQTTHNWLSAR
jgi:hypothetical protein